MGRDVVESSVLAMREEFFIVLGDFLLYYLRGSLSGPNRSGTWSSKLPEVMSTYGRRQAQEELEHASWLN